MTLLSFPFLKSASPHHSVPVLPAAPPLPPFPSMALITGILSPITRGLFSAAGFLYAPFYVLPAISPTRFFSPSSSLIPPSPFPFSSHFFMPGLPGSSPPSFPSVSISAFPNPPSTASENALPWTPKSLFASSSPFRTTSISWSSSGPPLPSSFILPWSSFSAPPVIPFCSPAST